MFAKNEIEAKKILKFKAYIGQDRTWWNYYNHYKSTIDNLVECIEGILPVNTVSLPLLFLIRHCLELGFKANILKLETVNNAIPKLKFNAKSHSLEFLFEVFKAHLLEIQKNHQIESSVKMSIAKYLVETQNLKDILHKLDKGSYNFRYPVDRNGKDTFEWDQEVNIADIVEIFYNLQPFLVFTDAVLYEHGVFGFDE